MSSYFIPTSECALSNCILSPHKLQIETIPNKLNRNRIGDSDSDLTTYTDQSFKGQQEDIIQGVQKKVSLVGNCH